MLITSFGCLGGLGGGDSEFGDFDFGRYPQNMSLTQVKTTLMSFVLLLGLLVFPSPASAEVSDTITTPGDGWDVTFHPTNQNYASLHITATAPLGASTGSILMGLARLSRVMAVLTAATRWTSEAGLGRGPRYG